MAYSVTSETRSVEPVVKVGGVVLQNVVGGTVTFSLDSPVPTADISLAGTLPSWIQRGDPVTVDLAGRIFTGRVKRRTRSPGACGLQCVGHTQRLWQPFSALGWSFANATALAAVEEILDDVGVTDRSLDMESWTIGTVEPVILDVTTPGDAVQRVIDVDGHKMFETPSGAFVVRKLLEVPAPTPFRTYTTIGSAPWVLDVADDEDEDQVKKKVYVTGAALAGVDSEGNETQDRVDATAHTNLDDLVEGDPELYAMSYQSELIQTAAKAGEVALRLLDKHHRVIEHVTLTVPFDPDIRLAMTIGLTDAAITGRSLNWFVEGYTHVFGEGEVATTVQLVGGDQSGTTGELDPVADFTYVADREVLGTGEMVIITFTAAAFDLDGSIADYHWTDDYAGGAMNVNGATLTVVTKVYDPSVDASIDVTLEVTDDDGNTDSITKTIDLTSGGSLANPNVFVPVVWSAAKNTLMCSPDGGFTWNDQACADGDAISVSGARIVSPLDMGYGIFGTSTGKLYRSTDRLQTAPSLVGTLDGAVNDIVFDSRLPGVVWACTEPGSLYKSADWGATWTQVLAAAVTGWPHKRIGTAGDSMVFLFGGDAADATFGYASLIRYRVSDGGSWFAINIGGELQADLDAEGGGLASYYVIDAASAALGELTIMLGGAGPLNTRIYFTNDVWGDGSAWTRCTGDTVGLTGPRCNAPNYDASNYGCFFDDRHSYTTTDGVAHTAHNNVLGAGVTAYHVMNVPGMKDLFFIALSDGIGKSADFLSTVDYLRPVAGISTWPAGAEARAISFEMQPQTGVQEPDTIYHICHPSVSGTFDLYKLDGTSWTLVKADLGAGTKKLKFLGETLWYVNDAGLNRSIDYGANFVMELALGKDITRDVDGTLWATTWDPGDGQKSKVWKSVNDGQDWSLVYTVVRAQNGAGQEIRLNSIACNIDDPQYIAVAGAYDTGTLGNVIAVSTDGGDTWTEYNNPISSFAGGEESQHVIWGQSKRLIAAGAYTLKVYTSDDYGASFTERDVSGSSAYCCEIIRTGNWFWIGATGATGNYMLHRTGNNGQTWEEIHNAQQEEHFGLVWSPDGNRLYANDATPNAAAKIAEVKRYSGIFNAAADVLASLTRLQYNWEATIDETDSACVQGIAIHRSA